MKRISYRLDFGALNGKDAKCNFNCVYCHKDYFPVTQKFNENNSTSFSQSINLLDQIFTNGNPKKIHISGRIEPLFVDRCKLEENLNDINLNFPKYEKVMTTNGAFLDQYLDLLSCSQINRINLSVHNQMQLKTKAFLKRIAAVKESNIKLSLNLIINESIPEILNMSESLMESGADLKIFEPLNMFKIMDAYDVIKMLDEKYDGAINTKTHRKIYNSGKGTITVKLPEEVNERPKNCNSCSKRNDCLEGCWESIRITPWYIKPCGVREDNVYYYEENSIESLKKKLISGSKFEEKNG